MQLLIKPSGSVCCLYDETIDLSALGSLAIQRGSQVEPNGSGQWLCDLAPVGGPILGPFATRSQALQAEVDWLHKQWLFPGA